ncbi:hypothetical protein ACRTC7_11040 [Vibrio fluvialis]|uniref:hypothetical protein n=1 Tax=Vibrio fluvialis TaxID=676 RepID=UPI003D7D0823
MAVRILLVIFSLSCAAIGAAQPTSTENAQVNFEQIHANPYTIKLQIDDKRQSSQDGSFSVTDATSILALLISLASMWYAHRLHQLNRKSSIHDDYWMRTVVYPNTVSKLMSFIEHSPSEFRTAGNNAVTFWTNYGVDESNKIRDTFPLLSVIDERLPPQAENIFDDMEDEIQLVQNEQDLKVLQAKVSKQLIDLLRNAQESV